MQHHHPGSWYLPWGVPLQKMLVTIPHHHTQAGAVYHTAGGPDGSAPGQPQPSSPFPMSAAGSPGQVMSQAMVQPQQASSGHSPTGAAHPHLPPGHRQPTAHYQAGPPSHPMHHHPMHHHHHHHPHAQQLHPHAAAAMFTPISLRSFLGHQTPHNMGALSQAQPPANSPLGNASIPVGQIPTMSLNVGVIPMQGGGRHGGGGQTGGLASPSCGGGGGGLGLSSQHSSPSATGAGLLMPMKKVTKSVIVIKW